MKVFVKRAYEHIVRDYPIYLNDVLASEITESIQKWYDQKDLVVTVQMLEDVAEAGVGDEFDWETNLTIGEQSTSLAAYINDYLNDATWESDEPVEVDGEVDDWDCYVTTADEFRGSAY